MPSKTHTDTIDSNQAPQRGAQSVTVRIPVQIDRAITPNGRAGWRKRYRLQQELKGEVIRECEGADLHLGHNLTPPLVLHYLIAHGKGRRTLDDDNAIASMKHVRDGIAQVLKIDDKHMTTGRVQQERDPEGIGYIEVAIEHAARPAGAEGQEA